MARPNGRKPITPVAENAEKALTIQCPFCFAGTGKRCKDNGNRNLPLTRTHAVRVKKILQEERGVVSLKEEGQKSLQFDCPYCKVKAGQLCKTWRRVLDLNHVHTQRRRLIYAK